MLDVWIREPADAEIDAAVRLLRALAPELRADLGCVHRFTEPERDEAILEERSGVSLQDLRANMRAPATIQLARGIDTLYWATYFGPAYVELFGRERIERLPVWRVEPVGDGYLVRLTERPAQASDWPGYRAARERAIDHLGRDAFWPIGTRVPIGFADFEPRPYRAEGSRDGRPREEPQT